MNKRLTATEYLFSIIMIFMLVCIAGAFFVGVKIGTDKADARYTAMLKKFEDSSREPTAYEQQVLVSFYHTIFTPYREYQNQWFDHLYVIDRSANADPSSLMQELGKLAQDRYNAMQTVAIPETSPLLRDAQQNYMKSLKLFSDASQKFHSAGGSMKGAALIAQIDKDSFLQEAKNFGLLAQAQYYHAIVEWNKTVTPDVKGTDAIEKANLSVKEWGSLGLNVKNAFIASYLKSQKTYISYYVQDVTMRVDEMITTGQAQRLNMNDVGKIADLLVSTGAIRSGDFIGGKDRWYAGETLPQLPFFFELR